MSDYISSLKNIDAIKRDIRIALVIGEFNKQYTSQLETETRAFFEAQGFSRVSSYWVP